MLVNNNAILSCSRQTLSCMNEWNGDAVNDPHQKLLTKNHRERMPTREKRVPLWLWHGGLNLHQLQNMKSKMHKKV